MGNPRITSAPDPGAVEAGAVTYIDKKLASFEAFTEPTYRGAPFVRRGDTAPAD